MSQELNSSGDDAPTSIPDWTKPYGVTTSRDRVGASFTRQASDYPDAGHSPGGDVIPVEVEDRAQRTESDADATIWKAFEEGY
ncbi:MAG TPA: hypothetical protein DEV93_18585 [Chloroflexi bacterium]|nr:hypothetical protein [Chloroflexota bacterium]